MLYFLVYRKCDQKCIEIKCKLLNHSMLSHHIVVINVFSLLVKLSITGYTVYTVRELSTFSPILMSFQSTIVSIIHLIDHKFSNIFVNKYSKLLKPNDMRMSENNEILNTITISAQIIFKYIIWTNFEFVFFSNESQFWIFLYDMQSYNKRVINGYNCK